MPGPSPPAGAPPLRNSLLLRAQRLSDLGKEYARVKPHTARLAEQPADAAAALAVGRFYCLHKDHWEKGLPVLARGGDHPLAQAARRELLKPEKAAEQEEAGKLWGQCAATENGLAAKDALARREKWWYRRALPQLTGLDETRLADRLRTTFGRAELHPGLIAEYFHGDLFNEKRKSKIEYGSINFVWGVGPPEPDIQADKFSIRWTGYLLVPRTGRYTFIQITDDGGLLRVDGKIVMNYYNSTFVNGRHGVVLDLVQGPHLFQFEFCEGIGSAACILNWIPEGTTKEATIPPEVLHHTAEQEKLLVR